MSVPTSKSIANRVLVCAALARGTSRISDLPPGDDTVTMLAGVSALGATVAEFDHGTAITGDLEAVLRGGAELHCGLAGTTSRFLTAVAALGREWSTVDGDAPLRARPNRGLVRALEDLGAETQAVGSQSLPVRIRRGGTGIGGRVDVDSSVSSQFVSGLMLAGPLMDRDLVVVLTGDTVSRPYVEMTASVMRLFGARVDLGPDQVRVHASGYAPCDCGVEADYSSAAFPLIAPFLRPGVVTVDHLSPMSTQGDARIVEILDRAGAVLQREGDKVTCAVSSTESLIPFDEDLRDCSDLLPALCVAATAVTGISTFRGVGFVRNKESDRLSAMAGELAKLEYRCEILGDTMRVHGRSQPPLTGPVVLDVHHDHRLAMSLAMLALRHPGVQIASPDAVAKSWPSYWRDVEPILGG